MLLQFDENTYAVWGLVVTPPKASIKENWKACLTVAYDSMNENGLSPLIDIFVFHRYVPYCMTARKHDCVFAVGTLQEYESKGKTKLKMLVGEANQGFISVSNIGKAYNAFQEKRKKGETVFAEGWDDPKRKEPKEKKKEFDQMGRFETVDIDEL